MYKGKSILAFICARKGSKGLKDKNIIDFSGKPLISWTIKAAGDSKYIDRIIVSTDGKEIAKISKQYGADVPYYRPKQLATDKALVIDAARHCFKWIEDHENIIYDYMILLQPTSPLRTTNQIDNAIESYIKNKKFDSDSLVSVVSIPQKFGWLLMKNSTGYVERCVKGSSEAHRRQDFAGYYLPNGAIYISSITNLKKFDFYSNNIIPFLMDENSSIDIDTQEDLIEALKHVDEK